MCHTHTYTHTNTHTHTHSRTHTHTHTQGEYTGLLVIKAFHDHNGEAHRNVCLIPTSAHGMRIIIITNMVIIIIKSVCVCVYVCVYIYVCVCVYIYVCVCVYKRHKSCQCSDGRTTSGACAV